MSYKILWVSLLLCFPLSSTTTSTAHTRTVTEVSEVCLEPYTVSDQEIAFLLLRRWEGFQKTSKWDVNAYRNGWGTRAKAGEVITLQEANRRSLTIFKRVQDKTKKKYPNLDSWEVSIISVMAYNVGGFGGQLDKALKSGDRPRIAQVMKRYVHSGGKKIEGLVNRRNDETRLLLSSPTERQTIALELGEIVNKHIQNLQNG